MTSLYVLKILFSIPSDMQHRPERKSMLLVFGIVLSENFRFQYREVFSSPTNNK